MKIKLDEPTFYRIQQRAHNNYINMRTEPRNTEYFNTMCHTYAILDDLVQQGILTHEIDAEGFSTYQAKGVDKK
jgi:hypothetical protein